MLFTCLIYLTGANINHFLAILLPDPGSSWYYWKLPTRNFFAMVLVWIFYLANQLLVWGLILWAQKNLIEEKTNPTYDLTCYNIAIVAYGFFLFFALNTNPYLV